MDVAASILVSGLVLGSLYVLMAGGLSLVWSTLRVFNFAHGALLTLSAYVGWRLAEEGGLALGLAVVGTVVVMVGVALVFEVLVIRPFIARPQGDLLVMVATLAAATIIVNGVQLAFGPQLKQLPPVSERSWEFAGTAIGANQLAAVVAAPILMGAVAAMLRFTRLGLAIRAVEQNRDFARLTGVDPQTVYLVTVAIAVALAAVAGLLLGGIRFVTPTMGDDPLLKAFVVVVFGGLARLSGTILGAYLIGLLEAVSTYYAGLFWTPVIIFSVMIVIMLVRPEGLVARRTAHA